MVAELFVEDGAASLEPAPSFTARNGNKNYVFCDTGSKNNKQFYVLQKL